MMNLTLTENQESRSFSLSKEDLEYLDSLADKRPFFIIRRKSKGISIIPDQIIGNLTLPSGLRFLIKPKMPLGSVLKMLSYVENSYQPLPSFSTYADDDELFSLLARLFSEETEKLLQKGLVQTHLPEVQVLRTIKGRILMKESMSTLPHQQLVCSSFNLTPDALENRTVVTALDLLLRTRTGSADSLSKMRSLRMRFPTSIQLLSSFQDFQKLILGRHNGHYHRVIHLAKLILRHLFFQQEFGQQTQPSFLVNMASLFERYVTLGLVEASHSYGVKILAQLPHYLDRNQRITSRPDLTMMTKDGLKTISILDTKYKKSLEKGTVANADVYQLLSYMIGSQSYDSWLVYPHNASQEPMPHLTIEIPVDGHIFRIHQIGFDTQLAPREAGSNLLAITLSSQSNSWCSASTSLHK